MRDHQYFVYIMANSTNSTVYIGVTNDIETRVLQHKRSENDSFTKKYNVHKLVYFEEHRQIEEAIAREKQLKNWLRAWKNELIEKDNPFWNDLSKAWF